VKNLTRFSLLSTVLATGLLSWGNAAWGAVDVTGDTEMKFTPNLSQECNFIATDGELGYKAGSQYKILTTAEGGGQQGVYTITCNTASGTLKLITFNKPTSNTFTGGKVTFDKGGSNVLYNITSAGAVSTTGTELALDPADNIVNVDVEANFSTFVDSSNTTPYELSIVADVVP
jgi:hypothetical protein